LFYIRTGKFRLVPGFLLIIVGVTVNEFAGGIYVFSDLCREGVAGKVDFAVGVKANQEFTGSGQHGGCSLIALLRWDRAPICVFQ
jgi:hypothetical protein